MTRAGCVKAAQGKPQSSRVKLKISPGTGEAKFSLGAAGEKNPLGRVSLGLLQRGVQNNMVFKISALGAFSKVSLKFGKCQLRYPYNIYYLKKRV